MKLYLISISILMMVSGFTYAITDPMQPPNMRGDSVKHITKSKTAKWRLTSVLIGQKRRLATINGKILSIGEKINGAKLIDIQPSVITLNVENRNIIIKLLPTIVKRQRRVLME